MHHCCHIPAIACHVIFKTLAHSDVVGVWWINPALPTQILHVGQYDCQHDVWRDGIRGGTAIWESDAACLAQRPAVKLLPADLACIRQQARELLALSEYLQTAA